MPRINAHQPATPAFPQSPVSTGASTPTPCAPIACSTSAPVDTFDADAYARAQFERDIKDSPFKAALRETFEVLRSQGFRYTNDNPGHSWGFRDDGGNKLSIEHGKPWLHPFKVSFYVYGSPSHWRPDQLKADLAFSIKFPTKGLDEPQRLAEFAQEVKAKAVATIPPMVAAQRAYMDSVICDIARGG